MSVFAGSNKKAQGYQKLVNTFSGKLFAHKNYKDPYRVTDDTSKHHTVLAEYDIALIKLTSKFEQVIHEGQYLINPICLPNRGEINRKEENATFFGYGLKEAPDSDINDHQYSDDLKKGDVLLGLCVYEKLFCANFQRSWQLPRPCGVRLFLLLTMLIYTMIG